MKTIRVATIYSVFEKLDNYYDDNDSTYITSFDNGHDAQAYVDKYTPTYNYYVKETGLYKTVK